MSMTVNGQEAQIPEPPTLENLLAILHLRKPYAVARNEEVILRSEYQNCNLMDGDRIEIMFPSAGG